MPNLNRVMLMGNLTRDPQLSYLPNQTAVVEIGLAINRTWTGQDGQKKEEVCFVDCSAFGKTADTLAKYLKKGRPVFIEGRLKYDQWEAQDGSKRSKLRVVIDTFQFIDSGGQRTAAPVGDGEGDVAPAPQAPRPAFNRTAGRPAAAPQAPRPAANMDADPPSQAEEDSPPITDSEIPF